MENSNNLNRKCSLVLFIQTVFYMVGIYIFTQGFLLNRLVVPKTSTCNDSIAFSTLSNADGEKVGNIESCWRPARFKRAVLIVIDALRYDFMLYNESLEAGNALSFQNKLGVIHELLKTKPRNGGIFKFVADPPTTTMQRIKGLTTGSLPTFIDAGSNFASSEIREDNVIGQLQGQGKKIVFMGDDTWMGLFPNSFERFYPYPSFNVKDLHTVDNGVISHLIPEIQKLDWDVIIAHFLGVDHCGHRYGPYHSAMAEKLIQMDEVLRSVVEVLDNDTILMVFGDHGMTKSGDHGGDSEDEVHAGLFVYSPTELFLHPQPKADQVVSQTDIVPTLSLLLGLPIPFSNLGIIIPSLFEDSRLENIAENTSKLHAFQLNARQVHRYITEYTQLSNDISSKVLGAISSPLFGRKANFSRDENGPFSDHTISGDILNRETAYLTYLKQIRELCRTVWAKFDIPAIQTGISIVAISCFISFGSIFAPQMFLNKLQYHNFYKYAMLATLLVFVPGCLLVFGYVWMFLLSFLLYGIVGLLKKVHINIIDYIKRNHIGLKEGVTLLLLFIQFAGYFSNSYVINEDKILLFFLQTVIVVLAIMVLTNSVVAAKFLELNNAKGYKTHRRKDRKKRSFMLMILGEIRRELACLFLIMVLFRLGPLFWPCREEQAACEPIEFLKTSSFSDLKQNGYQFWLSSMFLLLVPASLIFQLRANGNLKDYSGLVLAVKYTLSFGAIFACVHWLLQYVPAKMLDQNPTIGFFQQIITPCILYCCCLATLCCLICRPITAFVVRARDLKNEPVISTGQQSTRNAVVQIFKELRSELNEADNGENTPYVFGLGTVYSAAILILLATFALPVALVLGDGLGSSVSLMTAEMFLFLEIDKLMTSHEAVNKESAFDSLLLPVVTWVMISSYNFYSSGHQATIPSIRFEAAFVGLPGDMGNFILPGILILLNTFASDIIFVIALPLIIFWRKQTSNTKATDGKSHNSSSGEFEYHEKPMKLRADIFRVCALYQVSKGFKLLGAMSAAAVHRRHLMVWKIFAPRFIFEGVSFLITSFILNFVLWFVLRVDNALSTWCRTLYNHEDEL